jgi:hypothetical protein
MSCPCGLLSRLAGRFSDAFAPVHRIQTEFRQDEGDRGLGPIPLAIEPYLVGAKY